MRSLLVAAALAAQPVLADPISLAATLATIEGQEFSAKGRLISEFGFFFRDEESQGAFRAQLSVPVADFEKAELCSFDFAREQPGTCDVRVTGIVRRENASIWLIIGEIEFDAP